LGIFSSQHHIDNAHQIGGFASYFFITYWVWLSQVGMRRLGLSFAEAAVMADLRIVGSRSPMTSGSVRLDGRGIARIAAHSFTPHGLQTVRMIMLPTNLTLTDATRDLQIGEHDSASSYSSVPS
jgi:hypothetical protein